LEIIQSYAKQSYLKIVFYVYRLDLGSMCNRLDFSHFNDDNVTD